MRRQIRIIQRLMRSTAEAIARTLRRSRGFTKAPEYAFFSVFARKPAQAYTSPVASGAAPQVTPGSIHFLFCSSREHARWLLAPARVGDGSLSLNTPLNRAFPRTAGPGPGGRTRRRHLESGHEFYFELNSNWLGPGEHAVFKHRQR